MRIALLTVVAAFGLSACTNTQEPMNVGFGDAYHHNSAVHVINPTPANAGSGAPDLDGERGQIAIDRYRSSTTIAPEETTTTSDVTSE